jgi:hypothetical protein
VALSLKIYLKVGREDTSAIERESFPPLRTLVGSRGSERFAILANGRCFFGPSAKGLGSRRSLNLLHKNKLILRGATVGGLPLPKVLKNIINQLFSA